MLGGRITETLRQENHVRKRKPKPAAIDQHPDDGLKPGKTQQWREASGEPCQRHSAVHRYVAGDQKRCRQCDQEVGDKEVEAIVGKIQRERDMATAKAAPFGFITQESLRDVFGMSTIPMTEPAAPVHVGAIRSWEQARKEWYRKNTKSPCTEPCRWKLPDERKSLTHHFEIGDEDKDGVSVYVTVGFYEDWKVGEVFIKAAKMGGYISGFIDAFATSISISMQYGVSLKILHEKFKLQQFEPSGFVRGSPPEIKTCKSVLDYVIRWIDLRCPSGYLAEEFRGLAA
jgi:hypothetical protein